MHKHASIAIAALIILVSSLAVAAPVAATTPTEPTGAAGLITAITALLSAAVALVAALRGARKARKADKQATVAIDRADRAEARATSALAWADRVANAAHDGVVLLVTAPGAPSPCRSVLEANGWQVRVCEVTPTELAAGMTAHDAWMLLPGESMRADLAVADAIVLEGFDVAAMDLLGACRAFRELVRSGASVVMSTGGHNYRYDIGAWGVFAVATNAALTTEGAVRASLVRRAEIARLQGPRPGTLAVVREAVIAGGQS